MAFAPLPLPGGLTLVNVPPTTICVPTWVIALTVPSLMFGVNFDGAALTRVDWFVPDAAATLIVVVTAATVNRARPMLAALFRMFGAPLKGELKKQRETGDG